MFYSQAAYEEYQESVANDAMTDGEWRSSAVAEYAREHGRMHPDLAWITSPYDTIEANPFYVGNPVSYPYDGDSEEIPFTKYADAVACAARIAKTFGRSARVIRVSGGFVAQ